MIPPCSLPPVCRQLQFGTRRIPYCLHRSDRQRLRIVVSPDLSVDIYAPAMADEASVLALVDRKAAWISRQLDRISAFHPMPGPRRYVSGETFLYLGRQYRLKVIAAEPSSSSSRRRRKAALLGRFLVVQSNGPANPARVRVAVQDWYAERARDVFPRCVNAAYSIASRHGVPLPSFALRFMRTRWGSCTAKGRITLNVELIKTPIHCVEYVIMHELCHLVHHNHSRTFYRLLNRCMPDWQQRKRILDLIALPGATEPVAACRETA